MIICLHLRMSLPLHAPKKDPTTLVTGARSLATLLRSCFDLLLGYMCICVCVCLCVRPCGGCALNETFQRTFSCACRSEHVLPSGPACLGPRCSLFGSPHTQWPCVGAYTEQEGASLDAEQDAIAAEGVDGAQTTCAWPGSTPCRYHGLFPTLTRTSVLHQRTLYSNSTCLSHYFPR